MQCFYLTVLARRHNPPAYTLIVGQTPHRYVMAKKVLSQSPLLRQFVNNNDITLEIKLPLERNSDFVNIIEYLNVMTFDVNHYGTPNEICLGLARTYVLAETYGLESLKLEVMDKFAETDLLDMPATFWEVASIIYKTNLLVDAAFRPYFKANARRIINTGSCKTILQQLGAKGDLLASDICDAEKLTGDGSRAKVLPSRSLSPGTLTQLPLV